MDEAGRLLVTKHVYEQCRIIINNLDPFGDRKLTDLVVSDIRWRLSHLMNYIDCNFGLPVPTMPQPAAPVKAPGDPVFSWPAPRVGDYVLATKYRDGDPGDPWCVGFVSAVSTHASFPPRYIVDDGNGECFRRNGFEVARKIKPSVGAWIVANLMPVLENSTKIPDARVNIWSMLTDAAFDD